MNIPLNDGYRLSADKYQWIVQRYKGVTTDSKGVVKEVWESLSFHPTATKAVNHHADVLFRTSDAQTVDAAINEAKRITAELTDALRMPEFEVKMK